MQIDFDNVRGEFGIADHISDDVIAAFAENWISPADVPWYDLEDSFRGTITADSEDEAIGSYLFDLYEECGDLPEGPLRNYIDWDAFGRDGRMNGEFRAEWLSQRPLRIASSGAFWAIFGETDYWIASTRTGPRGASYNEAVAPRGPTA